MLRRFKWPTPPGYITPGEAANRLGHDRETIMLWLRRGWLPGIRKGRQWFLPSDRIPVTGRKVARRVSQSTRRVTSGEGEPAGSSYR